MEISVKIKDNKYLFDSGNYFDLSIPLDFNSAQPSSYGVGRAKSESFRGDDFVGDTRWGGSCNFGTISLNPHCNGTHTECVGHITNERISILEKLKDVFLLAKLITVKPVDSDQTNEKYASGYEKKDKLITAQMLENFIKKDEKISALIIRTLPNDDSKLIRNYLKNEAPFLTNDAMKYISELGINHLLCDMPSVDKAFDEGKLSNHRIFWNVEMGSNNLNENSNAEKTITEFIYANNKIADGKYLLNLQIAPFVLDAAPSRPIIFSIK
jgi:kynurenine formamidase